MKVTFKVEGLRECEHAMAELPKATNRNIVRRALMAAAAHIEVAARGNVTRFTGRLGKSITVGTKLSSRQRKMHRKESPVEVFVGAGPLPHAHMEEFGSAHNAPTGFLRKAVDSQGKAAIETFVEAMRSEIERARVRLARKAERIAAKIRASK